MLCPSTKENRVMLPSMSSTLIINSYHCRWRIQRAFAPQHLIRRPKDLLAGVHVNLGNDSIGHRHGTLHAKKTSRTGCTFTSSKSARVMLRTKLTRNCRASHASPVCSCGRHAQSRQLVYVLIRPNRVRTESNPDVMNKYVSKMGWPAGAYRSVRCVDDTQQDFD